ncbi:MAG: NAD(P)-binding protein [Steroidobacteraceae bacterium]
MSRNLKLTDRELGMDRNIPRRDFLQGALVGAAAVLTGPLGRAMAQGLTPSTAAQDRPGYYPPLLNRMRGSHPGSFEAAHALRDGAPEKPGIDTGESYDLIVVGGGISGLAAAHLYRSQMSNARILILDNHDDFGGHAKRNEFSLAGRMELLNGGTLSIESPRPYSAVAAKLIKDLGIDVTALRRKTEHPKFYDELGLTRGVFFDRETFGRDTLVAGWSKAHLAKALAESPLPERARGDILRIEGGAIDFLPGKSSAEKKLYLSKISYQAFLRDVVHADEACIAFYQARTQGWWGVGIDAICALDCWGIDLPGFKGMKLKPGSISRMGYTPAGFADTGGSETLHFPDGNATVARLLVRDLIPKAVPGGSAEDVVTARVDYSRLDRHDNPVRLRLSSTVIRALHAGDPKTARQVAVTYVRDGKTLTVRGNGCVLASWNMMIPYLCPELPAAQKAALHDLVKTPLVYTSVALRNWQSFRKLGIHSIYAPGCYHTEVSLNENVNIGSYLSPAKPEDPILVHMTRTPCKPGLSEHDQNKAGRAELLATSFETFERNIREQLARTLSAGGFDPAADIQAITVNRWPHGYAPEYNPLWEAELPPDQQPNVVGRARFGRIVIANSDSGRAAYTDSAIDQANRPVHELLSAKGTGRV